MHGYCEFFDIEIQFSFMSQLKYALLMAIQVVVELRFCTTENGAQCVTMGGTSMMAE